MSSGYSFPTSSPGGAGFYFRRAQVPVRTRYWLHLLLLLLTAISTTVVGAALARGFRQDRPFDFDSDLGFYVQVWRNPALLVTGLPFSLTLLGILMTHEMGHYLAARYYHVDASLPYFLPAPTLIGTLGAFIRIRSAIVSKRILFDIGISGPLAGFAVLVWPMAIGVSMSKVVPGIALHGDLVFGTPLILRLFEWIQFPGAQVNDICLHPVARAAWVGLLATALNLLPIGQLDGGHIVYAFLGEKTKYLSRILVAVFIPMGIFLAYSWLIWAVLLFFFGMKHPAIIDPTPLSATRKRLAVLALIVLVLSFTPAPVHGGGQ